jgi:hypothetical protein
MDLNCNYVVGRADGCRMVKIGAEFSKEERNLSRWLDKYDVCPIFNNCIGLDEYKFHQIEKKVHRIMK